MKLNTRRLVITGVLGGISIVMGAMPSIGFIPIPPFGATIMHIPVIIGAIAEGPVVGMLTGLIFGGFSMYQAWGPMAAMPASIFFRNPLVAVLPRILIGLTSYFAFYGIKRGMGKLPGNKGKGVLSSAGAAAIGTLTNTVGVMSMIYLLYAAQYAEKMGETVGKTIVTTVGIQAMTEVIVAIVIVTAVISALQRLYKRDF